MSENKRIDHKLPIISVSFLVLGNCLGVGVLALPIKSGLSGFFPALIGIIVIWSIMLISAWVIAYKINLAKSDSFDIPSFFEAELGKIGKWLAVVCNLILLYGVLIAYLSGISSMVETLFDIPLPQSVIVFLYFIITTSLIMFGMDALRKGNCFIIAGIWISFIVLIVTGISHFDSKLLTYSDWNLLPLGLPVAVSAFHFHNIIPTVSRALKHDVSATRKAIFIGVFLGLIINLIWVLVVLGTMIEGDGASKDSIINAFWYNLPATVPMSELLHSKVFTIAGMVFALLSVTASYMANGTGLFGFMRDLTITHLKSDNKFLVGVLSFLPPLVITLIYPRIFLSALDIVGGVGESILFIILPAFILVKLSKTKSKTLTIIGYTMIVIGFCILFFVISQKMGISNLAPLK